MVYALIAVSILLVIVIAAAAVLWTQRATLREQHVRLESDLVAARAQADDHRQRIEQLQQLLGERERDLSLARQSLDNAQKQFEHTKKTMEDYFASLANKALQQSTQQFLELAKQRLDTTNNQARGELDLRKQAIESMLKPIRESLDSHAKAVTEIEKSREGAYQGVRQQLASLLDDQRRLRQETANLVRALRRPEGRGRWGEMQLKRVAELAGMIEHCDFAEQAGIASDDRALRPDMVVKLPGDRTIVVDAKTPFDAFISAVEAEEDDQREAYLEQHARQVEQQALGLARKAYQSQFARTPDFVVMFIPGESFLQPAVQRRPQLLETAMNSGVVIATPSTLISLLKVVALGWREQRVAENATRISDLGKELHERIAVATDHVERLGRSLESSVKSYNNFVGSFESRVLVSARKFKELAADSPKELPAEGEVKQIEILPRTLRDDSGDAADVMIPD